MKKNGVFLFVISHLVPEIFKTFVLFKLGTDDVIRCDYGSQNTQTMTAMTSLEIAILSFFRHFSIYSKPFWLYIWN